MIGSLVNDYVDLNFLSNEVTIKDVIKTFLELFILSCFYHITNFFYFFEIWIIGEMLESFFTF
jgi:hypothetical protein